jgi:hypothetical protein
MRRHALRDNPAEHVGHGTRRIGRDDVDGAIGEIVLCSGHIVRGSECGQRTCQDAKPPPDHRTPLPLSVPDL